VGKRRRKRAAAAPPPPSPERFVVLALFVGFWALYYLSVGIKRPNLYWYNFIFDADPGRVLDDALRGQNPAVFSRHPLFALTIGGFSNLLGAALGSIQGVLAAVAGLAALGVAASFACFRRICGRVLPALCFSLLYGCSAAVWLLGSIPETFAVSSTIIVGAFLLHRPEYGQPLRHKARFALASLLAAVGMGVTVPNFLYSALAYASNSRAAQPDWRRRLASLAAFGGMSALLFLLLGAIQQVGFLDYTGGRPVSAAPADAIKRDPYFKLHRPLVGREAVQLTRHLVADNLLAPAAQLTAARTDEGAMTMIQYGGAASPLYLVVLLALALFVIATAWQAHWREILREPTAQLALLFVGYNLVFYYFYRANGQPFIFSIYNVFPILVLLAHLYRQSGFHWRTASLAVATGLTLVNNAVFLFFVDRTLELDCAERLGNVCLSWRGDAVDSRLNQGIPEFLASAEYPYELGRKELAEQHLEESIPHFRRSLELNGRHRLARLYLGYALIQAGRFDEAITHLEESLRGDPADPELQKLLEQARQGRPRPD
jgi:tetratricopeptide (TPR) repeat protein